MSKNGDLESSWEFYVPSHGRGYGFCWRVVAFRVVGRLCNQRACRVPASVKLVSNSARFLFLIPTVPMPFLTDEELEAIMAQAKARTAEPSTATAAKKAQPSAKKAAPPPAATTSAAKKTQPSTKKDPPPNSDIPKPKAPQKPRQPRRALVADVAPASSGRTAKKPGSSTLAVPASKNAPPRSASVLTGSRASTPLLPAKKISLKVHV